MTSLTLLKKISLKRISQFFTLLVLSLSFSTLTIENALAADGTQGTQKAQEAQKVQGTPSVSGTSGSQPVSGTSKTPGARPSPGIPGMPVPGQATSSGKTKKPRVSKNNPSDRKFSDRRAVQIFLWDVYVKHKINLQNMKQLLKISPDPKVIQAISKPFEEVSWSQYREKFVNDERAKAGVVFWKNNAAALKKAEEQFGVPAEIIVAIIGVETYYGRNTGNFLVIQSLATLAFDYPPRAQFFKSELEQYLILLNEEKLDGRTLKGSYAGAIGLPQFMPSSWRRYAVDFSGKGYRNLVNDVSDAIGSVGNYLNKHGWEKNEPVALLAQVYGSEYQRLANTNMKDPLPRLTLADFSRFNIQPKDKKGLQSNKNAKAAFIMFNDKTSNPEYWLTMQNFYVITRYNHSVNYAMAVYQLAQRIRELNTH